MHVLYSLVFLTVLIIKAIETSKLTNISKADVPLSRSLGFSLDSKAEKKLQDAMFSQGYFDQYHEMMRASRESFESFERGKERRRRRGKSGSDRDGYFRRGGERLRSELGRRRARSQALRRNKLNIQSVKNHLEHTKRSSPLEWSANTSEDV